MFHYVKTTLYIGIFGVVYFMIYFGIDLRFIHSVGKSIALEGFLLFSEVKNKK